MESFYFWPNHQAGLKEIKRVLKPGGKILIIADTFDSPKLTEKEWENIKKYKLYNPTPQGFKDQLEAAGFSDVKNSLKRGYHLDLCRRVEIIKSH